MVEGLKSLAEKVTGVARPSKAQLPGLVRRREARTLRFEDDGVVPNHPRWPLILYRNAVKRERSLDPAAIIEDIFKCNGWCDSWRNGIYNYVHYHSRIHEVLGVARGHAQVQFGGLRGKILTLRAGDVAILPAGTGHQCLSASSDFLVVGAYPRSGTYDLCTSSEDHEKALKTIPKVRRPAKDPVYGASGATAKTWRAVKTRP